MNNAAPFRSEPAASIGREPVPGPELAVVVPTFNERDNVPRIVELLGEALTGLRYEVIFVDDNSPDGTADTVSELAQGDGQLRCIRRIGRRGLSTAIIEGILATTAPVAAVIDGDLQHDETRLKAMLQTMRDEDADVVVGSRYVGGGSTGDWDETRIAMSKLATRIAAALTGVTLTDPMSGFFMVRTDTFREHAGDLSGAGYKTLLDLLATRGAAFEVREIPYEFRSRQAGESKLDTRVLLDFMELLIAKTVGRYVPTRFVMFSMVGGLGVLVHMSIVTVLFGTAGVGFGLAQGIATLCAMVANFFVNNVLTYRDRRITGWRLIPGLLSFCAVSAVGAVANVGVAIYIFDAMSGQAWVLPALAGIVVGAAWNYAASALYTWKT